MKAIKFIEQRTKLSNEITKYWDIISKQNVIPRALKRTHDLKALYNEILLLGNQRALVKLKLIAINMGYKKFKDLGYLVKGKIDRQWLVNQILLPQVIKDRVQITLILKIKDEEN